mmetsp:Transcript_33035/g.78062  ORF Transcript_33035/g.78062 Transcript_33035/m.78062 type:complete len:116 (-) Transcript_33035:1215-1562(-)
MGFEAAEAGTQTVAEEAGAVVARDEEDVGDPITTIPTTAVPVELVGEAHNNSTTTTNSNSTSSKQHPLNRKVNPAMSLRPSRIEGMENNSPEITPGLARLIQSSLVPSELISVLE